MQLLFTGCTSLILPAQSPEGQRYFQEAPLFGIPSLATQLVANTEEVSIVIRQLLQRFQSTDTSTGIMPVTCAQLLRRAQRWLERQGLEVLPFSVDF